VNPYRESPEPDWPCPRCGIALSSRPIADARVDECPRCAGVFVPASLMPRLTDALDLAGEVLEQFPEGEIVDFPRGRMYVKCPRCRGVMNRELFARGARVIVDICREHGVWFGDAELRAAAEFVAGGGMEHARRLEAEERRALRERVQAMGLRDHAEPIAAARWSLWSALLDAITPGRR
jgi:Zn-finger nucleic acid-binding protein